MADEPLPDAHSGLPKPVERLLMRPYGGSASGRIGASATLRALSVLIRKHPKAAFDMVRAGAAQAGRAGFGEITSRLTGRKPTDGAAEFPPDLVEQARTQVAAELGAREVEKVRKLLDDKRADRD